MFDRMQYAMEEKTSLVPGFRETYEVKDISGNLLLGYAKKQRGRDNFWFEGTDGTRIGEIRYAGAHTYTVYDAQNQLQGIMKQIVHASEEKRWRRGLILLLSGLPMALLGALGAYIRVAGLAIIGLFGALALGASGLIYLLVMVGKGQIGGWPEWQLEDSKNRKLISPRPQILTPDESEQLQILTPDGDVLAEIRIIVDFVSPLRARFHWSIVISRQGFEPILILSYAVLRAHRSRPRD